MLQNRRVICGECGEVWTTRAPLSTIVCGHCDGTFEDLLISETQHHRCRRKGGAIVWSGTIDRRRFFLVSYPDGRITAAVK